MKHYEASAAIGARPDELFAYADDPLRLAGHMGQSSPLMRGGHVDVRLDAARGQAAGSHIVMAGRAFGFELFLDEVVDEREPPRRKTWHTVGEPRLVVIGHYRMGFEITPDGGQARMRVFIDYGVPERRRWLGRLFGPAYARWCARRMVLDARKHFARRRPS